MASAAAGCKSVTGTYAEQGLPAPDNSRAYSYSLVWPTVGSLASILSAGANGVNLNDIASVQLLVTPEGQVTFSGIGSTGGAVLLAPRDWRCEGGVLVTHAWLTAAFDRSAKRRRDQSYVRLWKAADGALIAENTIQSITVKKSGSSTEEDPQARFYFRFAPLALTP